MVERELSPYKRASWKADLICKELLNLVCSELVFLVLLVAVVILLTYHNSCRYNLVPRNCCQPANSTRKFGVHRPSGNPLALKRITVKQSMIGVHISKRLWSRGGCHDWCEVYINHDVDIALVTSCSSSWKPTPFSKQKNKGTEKARSEREGRAGGRFTVGQI